MIIDFIHNKCGNIAFHYSEVPEWGDVIRAEKTIKIDGTKPKDGDIIVCGSCGEEIGGNITQELTIARCRD